MGGHYLISSCTMKMYPLSDVSWEPCIIYQYCLLINELSCFLVFLYIFVVLVEDDDMILSEEWLVWCFWKSQALPSTASVEMLWAAVL